MLAAQPGSYFSSGHGWSDDAPPCKPSNPDCGYTTGNMVWWPEWDKKLGPPKADYKRDGMVFTREFEHLSVSLDCSKVDSLNGGAAGLVWKNQDEIKLKSDDDSAAPKPTLGVGGFDDSYCGYAYNVSDLPQCCSEYWAGKCNASCPVCLPTWKPTWDLFRSTVYMACNSTGWHAPEHASNWGLVVYDWSNNKPHWAKQHPMNMQKALTVQAEMTLDAMDKLDRATPGSHLSGFSGGQPRVWACYRNSIRALNFMFDVRTTLDDPKYASWYATFKNYRGRSSNGSYHVPACDWFGDAKSGPPKCSGFYHDQEQAPEHPGLGGWPAYHWRNQTDDVCTEQCDCGPTNPCGNYIFDHRGKGFRDWFVHKYIISNDTYDHRHPVTGAPQPIGIGWLDDQMTLNGPTEEDSNYIADTGVAPGYCAVVPVVPVVPACCAPLCCAVHTVCVPDVCATCVLLQDTVAR